jgi:hypothetical protein
MPACKETALSSDSFPKGVEIFIETDELQPGGDNLIPIPFSHIPEQARPGVLAKAESVARARRLLPIEESPKIILSGSFEHLLPEDIIAEERIMIVKYQVRSVASERSL